MGEARLGIHTVDVEARATRFSRRRYRWVCRTCPERGEWGTSYEREAGRALAHRQGTGRENPELVEQALIRAGVPVPNPEENPSDRGTTRLSGRQ